MFNWLKHMSIASCVAMIITLPTYAADDPVKVVASWGGKEEAGFREVLEAFTESTGIPVEYEGIRTVHVALKSRVAAGNSPDIALMPRPGEVAVLARQGVLADLGPMVDSEQMAANFGGAWIDLGTVDGTLVGLITKANSKSFVWYRSDVLAKYVDSPPTTWEEFTELAEKMRADGLPPHAIAGGKAWTLTDWFENIYLRVAGPEAYLDLFTKHTVAWTDPSVKEAMARFGDIVGSADLIAGGPSVALSLHYKDALAQVLTDPPQAGMFMEGGFMKNFAKESFGEMECGKQFGAFLFPAINPDIKSPVVGGGDLAIAFNSNDNTKALIQYLASAEAMTIWAKAKEGAVVSPHKGVPNSVYDDCTAQEAVALKEAIAFVFDGSDLSPGAVGGDALPSGLQEFISEPEAVDDILDAIESAASHSY